MEKTKRRDARIHCLLTLAVKLLRARERETTDLFFFRPSHTSCTPWSSSPVLLTSYHM